MRGDKFLFFALFALLFGCSGIRNVKKRTDFELTFMSCGLGSNLCTKQPVFRVNGNDFVYTLEQNSFYDQKERAKIDTICTGVFRSASIDSIIVFMKSLKDSSIYETNSSVMSGTLDRLMIKSDTQSVNFTLHNASHPVAEDILNVMNSNIPKYEQKLSFIKL